MSTITIGFDLAKITFHFLPQPSPPGGQSVTHHRGCGKQPKEVYMMGAPARILQTKESEGNTRS